MATMSQAIKEAFGESGGVLSREAIKQSVESRYPGKWRPATLSAHLYACAINNPKAYVHHPNSERFLYKHADVGWHQQHQGAGTVRGILVASDFPEGVQYAALAMPNLALRRYRIQLTFADASL